MRHEYYACVVFVLYVSIACLPWLPFKEWTLTSAGKIFRATWLMSPRTEAVCPDSIYALGSWLLYTMARGCLSCSSSFFRGLTSALTADSPPWSLLSLRLSWALSGVNVQIRFSTSGTSVIYTSAVCTGISTSTVWDTSVSSDSARHCFYSIVSLCRHVR